MKASALTVFAIPILSLACSAGADSQGDPDPLDDVSGSSSGTNEAASSGQASSGGPSTSGGSGGTGEATTDTSSASGEAASNGSGGDTGSDGSASSTDDASSSGSSTDGNASGSGGAADGGAGSGDPTSTGDTTSDGAGTGGSGGTPSIDTTTTGGEVETEPAPEYPSWANDVLPIFSTSCGADNTACHSEAVYIGWPDSSCRGWLSLVNAPLGSTFLGEYRYGETNGCPDYPLAERLLMQPWQCESGQYVVPGDAQASYLYRKIAGGPYCDLEDGPSEPMPQVGTLSQRDIDIIGNWIDSGAPFDN